MLQPLALMAQAKPAVEFTLKPNLCVLSKTETQCQDRLVVEWKSLQAQNLSLCLYKEQTREPLYCWQQSQSGRTEFTTTLAKTTAFELRDQQQQLFARELFEVIYTGKNSLRARRNPWSFF